MIKGITFRPSLLSDLDEVSEVDKAAFGECSYPRFLLRQMLDIHGKFFKVAVDSYGIIVAYTLGAVNLDEGKEGWIMALAVKPPLRRAGIGRALTKELVAELVNRGVEDILLTVNPANVAAISLYERLHFIRCGSEKEYFGKGEERLIMGLKKKTDASL